MSEPYKMLGSLFKKNNTKLGMKEFIWNLQKITSHKKFLKLGSTINITKVWKNTPDQHLDLPLPLLYVSVLGRSAISPLMRFGKSGNKRLIQDNCLGFPEIEKDGNN